MAGAHWLSLEQVSEPAPVTVTQALFLHSLWVWAETVKVTVQAAVVVVSAAFGVTWGTVGATGEVVFWRKAVMVAMAPKRPTKTTATIPIKIVLNFGILLFPLTAAVGFKPMGFDTHAIAPTAVDFG